jgi:hypothetical protein
VTTELEIIKKLYDCLKWYVDEDDTYRGDRTSDGGPNWEEENEYWIQGLEQAEQVLTEVQTYLQTVDLSQSAP